MGEQTSMKSPRFSPAVFVAALSALAISLGAQDASPAIPVLQQPKPTAAPSNITLNFSGGTLAQLVAAVAKTPGGPLNLIGDQADLAVAIPAFSLNNANQQVLAFALNRFLETRGMTIMSSGISMQGSTDVYIVRRNPNVHSTGPRDAFESIQLAPFLEHQKIDDIVGAVRAAWELDPAHDASALRLKYHPATTLLLVSGPQEAINVAQKVVTGTLKRTSERDPKMFTPTKAPPPATEKP